MHDGFTAACGTGRGPRADVGGGGWLHLRVCVETGDVAGVSRDGSLGNQLKGPRSSRRPSVCERRELVWIQQVGLGGGRPGIRRVGDDILPVHSSESE